MKLYEITGALIGLLTDDDQLCEDWESKIDALDAALADKCDSIARLLRNWTSRSDAISAEIERLRALKKGVDSRIDSLKTYSARCIGQGNRVETELFTLSVRQSEAVVIDEEGLIPEGYMREKVTAAPDKDEIKRDLKNGAIVPGARIEKRLNLIIK